MKRQDYYEMHRVIHRAEVNELINVVLEFGGEAHFGLDYTGEHATGTERPCVTANQYGYPVDYYINAVTMKDGFLRIIAEQKEESGEPCHLTTDDIEFGHVSFITGQIPDREDKGSPTLVADVTVNTIGGQWVSINTKEQTWEFQQDANDDDTYISGSYETDNDRPCTVIGYDGCCDIPLAVKNVLRYIGYALDL